MENSSLNTPESGQVNLNSNVELEPVLGEIVPQILSNELSEEEEKERQRLERQVERAFYQAGRSLKLLRDLKLYRDRYATFEEYCLDRFNFKRAYCYHLINAALVYDNLLEVEADREMYTSPRPPQELLNTSNELQMSTPRIHFSVLPSSEYQLRPLVSLKDPQKQKAVWSQVLKETEGKAPSQRKVKEVRDRMYPKEPSKKPEIAHHLKLQPRGLVEINTPHLVDLHQRYGRIYLVHKSTVKVWARNIESMTMNLHKLKHSEVEPVPFEFEPQLMSVRSRLEKLFKLSLDPLDREILMLLERPVAFTPREMECLEAIEARYSK